MFISVAPQAAPLQRWQVGPLSLGSILAWRWLIELHSSSWWRTDVHASHCHNFVIWWLVSKLFPPFVTYFVLFKKQICFERLKSKNSSNNLSAWMHTLWPFAPVLISNFVCTSNISEVWIWSKRPLSFFFQRKWPTSMWENVLVWWVTFLKGRFGPNTEDS